METELQKNQELTVEIDDCTSEGQGVAHAGGRAIFVQGALPGERCRIQILKANRSAVYARVLEYLTRSPHRVVPDCPYYGRCGGCDFRHVDYQEELRIKRKRVNDALQRIGGVSVRAETILPAAEPDRYRGKAIFAVGRDRAGRAVTGFYRARSHEVIPVEDCLLQSREANAAAAALRRWMDENHAPPYDETSRTGLVRHIFIRAGMVCVVATGRLPAQDRLLAALREACPDLRSVILNRNRSEGNTVLSGAFQTLWGADTVDVPLSGLRFRLSPQSFFQVNAAQAERLYALALDYAALTGRETVVDLYCGAGAIGLLAAARAREVVGVELVPDAVEDAKRNAALAGIENIRFLCADAAQAAARFADEGRKPDVLFVDPPRKGLEEAVISSIAVMSPSRVVYVSCDPGTLARDLGRFAALGYQAAAATAVDMFPRTRHVECCVLMSRVKD